MYFKGSILKWKRLIVNLPILSFVILYIHLNFFSQFFAHIIRHSVPFRADHNLIEMCGSEETLRWLYESGNKQFGSMCSISISGPPWSFLRQD